MAAPLRLCEQWASLFRRRFSPRRKDAKAAKEKRPLLWRHLILKDHKPTAHVFFFTSRQRRLNCAGCCDSIVADATWMLIPHPPRGIKPTAKFKAPLRGGRKAREFCFPYFI